MIGYDDQNNTDWAHYLWAYSDDKTLMITLIKK